MKNRGFTLIELLVVIAIIAILAAILFPVFAKAREKARSSTCLSNLKQVGLSMMQYLEDYDGVYPFCETWGGGEMGTSTFFRLRSYGISLTANEGGRGYNSQLLVCPSHRPDPSGPGFMAVYAQQVDTSYGWNSTFSDADFVAGYGVIGSYSLDVYVTPPLTRHESELVAPSGTFLAMDSRYHWVVDATAAGGPFYYSAQPHLGGTNVVFCDGHVKAYRPVGQTYWLPTSIAKIDPNIPDR